MNTPVTTIRKSIPTVKQFWSRTCLAEALMAKGGWRRGQRSGEEVPARTTYLISEFKLKLTGTGTAGSWRGRHSGLWRFEACVGC